MIGLTDAERDYANSGKVDDLLRRLAVAKAVPVIRPDRLSVV